MANEIYLSNVRLSFPKLIEAQAQANVPNPAKKFSADFILSPSDKQFAQFMGEIGTVATAKWKDMANAVLQHIQTDRKLRCFGNGAEKVDKKTMKPYSGYDGMVYIGASSNEDRPPLMVRPDGVQVDNANTLERVALARKLYGGCYVNAVVRPWCQDNQFGRGVRCELIAVQFANDGDAFGEAPADVTGMFGAVQQPAAAAAPTPNFFGTTPPPWAA